ncbi:MAG: M28 family peptidase [Promethearchaeota archaeon]
MSVEILEEDSKYMHDIIEKIIDECGPRMPCSPQEAKSAEIIKSELEKTCEQVEIEPFTCHPRAALGWIKIAVFLMALSFTCFFLTRETLILTWKVILPILTFALVFIGILIMWKEFFNYEEFIDFLFRKKESQNVIGTLRGKGDIKKLIIFSGHNDSALQFNLLKYFKVGYIIIVFLGIFIFIAWFLYSAIFLIATIIFMVLGSTEMPAIFFIIAIWFLIIGGIPMILLLFFVSPGELANKVPGAVDNLSAVAIVLAIGKMLKRNKELIPDNTEIRLISFGCEEAFLRGAFRYVEKHYEELKKLDTEVVNMDAIASKDDINVLKEEPTTRTIHSEVVVQKLVEASKLVGVKVSTAGMGGAETFLEKIYGQMSGGTDATAFSKAGIKASTIMSMRVSDMVNFYHQSTDTPDKIEDGALENVLKLCLGYLAIERKK